MFGRWSFLTALAALVLVAAGIAASVALRPEPKPEQAVTNDLQAATMVRLLENLAERSEEDAFDRFSEPWQLSLPDDHGGHPTARSETWLMTAHLQDADGTPIGVTFLLSRFGLRSAEPASDGPSWDIRALYGGQVMLVRQGDVSVRSELRLSRGAGAAGHDKAAGEVWLDNWQLTYGASSDEAGLRLEASAQGIPISLELAPLKAPVPSVSEDAAPVRGFALPRLEVQGRVGFDRSQTPVSGHAWLDRLWGEVPLPGGPLAYDRMILQLDDGTDVSVLRSRRRDGRGSATLDGMIVRSSGEVATLSEETIEMSALAHQTADVADTPQLIEWRLDGQKLGLRITPLTESQSQGFLMGGWNGMVSVSGRHDGREVGGFGTLQLTGYEEL